MSIFRFLPFLRKKWRNRKFSIPPFKSIEKLKRNDVEKVYGGLLPLDEYCAVVNCKKKLKEGEYIEIDGTKYCKSCAALIAKEIVLGLMKPRE